MHTATATMAVMPINFLFVVFIAFILPHKSCIIAGFGIAVACTTNMELFRKKYNLYVKQKN